MLDALETEIESSLSLLLFIGICICTFMWPSCFAHFCMLYLSCCVAIKLGHAYVRIIQLDNKL